MRHFCGIVAPRATVRAIGPGGWPRGALCGILRLRRQARRTGRQSGDSVTQGARIGANDIAIVGMAAHLPGAPSVSAYWDNLVRGIESIRPLTEDDLLAAGESPSRMRHPRYVRAAAPLDGFERFDAEFFGFSPKEAAILDPQHRQFLEVAWEALEDAGHPPEGFPGAVGIWAGCGMGSYFYFNLCSNPGLVEDTGMFLLRHTGNDKDFLATRVSHVFDFKGPSINVQTACSTSLVAVHYACQALLNGECDMALAGGVTVELPQGRGYVYQEGEILSPDGHCHAFDHRAQGTVFGSGAGCVVLRRLADAIADGDHVWAVIKGSAVNNDGAAKAGYLAPSVEGQAACIAEAQAVAGISADSVGYVECHGTGTYLGDPIEVAALTQAFRETTDAVDFCRIGSVKTNIGHLDTAAGVASLIKASLAVTTGTIPPTLGFEAPNPAIAFDGSPFRVADRLTDFPAGRTPRRAGVNSLGVGGTNAHVVIEEPPARPASPESDWPFQPLVISARSRAALDEASARLAAHLRAHPEQPLADVAWTLKQGRRHFEKRRVIVAENHAEAAALLEGADARRVWTHDHLGEAPQVVFMFPGGGAQYAGMARDLYETEPVFRDWVDRGLAVLEPRLDYSIRDLWLPARGAEAAADARLKRPSVQLPLIMIVEYALARLFESWGVTPHALIGHSMGENTAACLAGVLRFEDCIGLVHLRGQLFDTVPPGGMLSVPMDAADLVARLPEGLDMASVNAPGLCVVSGPDAMLADLASGLAAEGIETQRVAIDIAAHSRMLEPILGRFGDFLRSIPLSPPVLPVISNRTGRPLTAAEATDPEYWVAHLRSTVRFAEGMAHLVQVPGRVFMEMGPGRALSSLAQANGVAAGQVIPALRHPGQAMADDAWHMATIARLWACGVTVDWEPVWGEAARQRVPLPTYPFQRKPYFISPGTPAAVETETAPARSDDIARWGWVPHWRPRAADCAADVETELDSLPRETWAIFTDETGLAAACADRLRDAGHRVVTVRAGDAFRRDGDAYTLSPERGREGYDLLVRDLVARGLAPTRVAHFWLVTATETFRPGSSFFQRNLEQGFWSLLFLGQAMAEENVPRPVHMTVMTTGAARLRDGGLAHPEKAAVAGPARIIPRELPGVTCTTLDLELPASRRGGVPGPLVVQVLEEMLAQPADSVAALRGARRFERGLRAVDLPVGELPLAEGATVMVTGGFGGIGLTLAEDLIRNHKAKILIVARRPLPPRDGWAAHLAARGPDDAASRRILAMQRLDAIGGTVEVAVADVCNPDEMRAAVALGEARLGRIAAVIHAAGVVDDGPMLGKTPGGVEEVLAPKLHGTQVLDAIFPDGRLDWMVVFASTSTVTAPAGQVDYVAANEFLNAWAQSRAGGKTRVVALNWGIWSGVGMAAEALADRLGTRPAAPRLPVSGPLLTEASFDATGRRVYEARLTTADWVLDQHRMKGGQAVFPGTGYLELVAEAARAEGMTAFELADLTFFRALEVADGDNRALRLRLTATDEGFAVEVQSGVTHQGRQGWITHAQGRLAPLRDTAPGFDTGAALRCGTAETGEGLESPQEAHLAFGARWRVIRSRAFGNGEGVARLALPVAFGAEAGHWPLHPALMDLATGWAMPLIPSYSPSHLWVPLSYGRLRVFAPLPAEVTSHVRLAPGAAAGSAAFDIVLADPEGRVVAEVRGFSMRRIEGALTAAPVSSRDLEFDDTPAKRSLTAAEERLAANLVQGIRPAEGVEAFARALSLGSSHVYVSSLDLPALIAQAARTESARPEGQSFERPDLDTAFVEPRNEIERTLAGFWTDLLGVAKVGVEDDFFALGGHSLIAVRLFAMVKKAFRVEFPISVLFEAPTIAACARLIEDRIGPVEAEGARPQAAAPRRRFTHLVPMHERDGGPGTPFFLVAGMFGNVLNLRHLAQLLGGDRPFYGLQARGLYGDEAPHESLPAAAADIIAEMRQVQPHGPFLLGGFSGGGLTAWEIARQLEGDGEEVAMLALLDTPLPVRPALSRADKAMIKLAEFRRKGPAYAREWLQARAEWKRRLAAGPAAEAEGTFHNAAIEAAFRASVADYTLPQRMGATVLFRPPLDRHWRVTGGRWVSRAREYVSPDNDLTPFAPALRVIEVPGDHDSMVLEPNVRVLAARLRAEIAGVETPSLAPLARAAE
ncbi:MAG: KR domain-containing protein [Paracoccaceae bacterium]|nr:MAG: KR domain-containing protein [Paracoccaceae bacterium]